MIIACENKTVPYIIKYLSVTMNIEINIICINFNIHRYYEDTVLSRGYISITTALASVPADSWWLLISNARCLETLMAYTCGSGDALYFSHAHACINLHIKDYLLLCATGPYVLMSAHRLTNTHTDTLKRSHGRMYKCLNKFCCWNESI